MKNLIGSSWQSPKTVCKINKLTDEVVKNVRKMTIKWQ